MAAAGTLTLTQNSTAVNGSGTAFTTALAVGGFIVVTVGGTAYTLGIKSIESNTALTLQVAYNGPTASGVSFDYVPFATLNLITSALAAQVTYAIRSANLDRNNWQQIFSGTGNVTVTLPDGTSWTGPAWNTLSNSLSGKADKSALGNSAGLNVGTTPNTVAAGNDSRLSTVGGKTGGTISSSVAVAGALSTSGGGLTIDGRVSDASGNVTNTITLFAPDASFHSYIQYYLMAGQYHATRIVQNGTATFMARSNGSCYAASFNPTSDERLKLNKEKITNALSKVMTLSGYTFDLFGERKTGGLAQEIQKVLPEVVTETFMDHELPDGTHVKNGLAVDYGATFGLMVEAIKELNSKIDQRDALIDDMIQRLKALDGLDG